MREYRRCPNTVGYTTEVLYGSFQSRDAGEQWRFKMHAHVLHGQFILTFDRGEVIFRRMRGHTSIGSSKIIRKKSRHNSWYLGRCLWYAYSFWQYIQIVHWHPAEISMMIQNFKCISGRHTWLRYNVHVKHNYNLINSFIGRSLPSRYRRSD